jgi:CrcB protein
MPGNAAAKTKNRRRGQNCVPRFAPNGAFFRQTTGSAMTFIKLVCLGLAGAAGALARFWLSELLKHTFASQMPWGTWAVNVAGCFVFGFVWALTEERGAPLADFRLYALVGFAGAFTTFSTYIFESVTLARGGAIAYALINIAGQNLAGIIALLAGMAAARYAG